ncbi:MAG: hypothetical protein LCH95_01990 [Proteobacteria bacterium]|nr:hypothetical protein [Pseudomonadota bacterium]
MLSIKLKGALVERAGVTARTWHAGTSGITLQVPAPGKGVRVRFAIDSKGGGQTDIQYRFDSRHYKAHFQAMLANDRKGMLEAVGDFVREELVGAIDREAKVASRAERTATEAAQEALIDLAYEDWPPYGTPKHEAGGQLIEGLRKLIAKSRKRSARYKA